MKKWRIYISLICIGIIFSASINATEAADTTKIAIPVPSLNSDRVIIGKDTVDIIIPEKNYGRYDRGLSNFLFIPKGQWSFGLTVSYGSISSEDLQLLNILKDFDLKGSIFSLKPYISYFFRNNSAIGMRLGYSKNNVDLGKLSMDFGSDLNFSLADVLYNNEYYSASVFYRHYIGLGRDKRFGVFNEIDLAFGSGIGQFKRSYDGVPRDTRTVSSECRLNFSPGVCVFFHDYVSFNVSFGVFGLYFKNEKQTTNGENEGSHFSSGADFKFNLFNINLGIAVHI